MSIITLLAQIAPETVEKAKAEAGNWWNNIVAYILNPDFLGKLIVLLIVTVAVVIAKVVFRMRFSHRIVDDDKRYYANKAVTYASYVIVLLVLITVIREELRGLGTVIGLVGAGIAIALSDVITSFAGWFVIISERGFKTGDRVKVGEIKGDVVDIGLLRTTLMEVDSASQVGQATGTIVVIPNSKVFKEPVVNYTMGNEYVWYETRFLFTYESDWRAAEKMIYAAVYTLDMEQYIKMAAAKIKSMTRQFRVKFGKLTPIVYASPDDSGIRMTLRFITPVRLARVNEDHIARKVIAAVEKHPDVAFAYPTMRVVPTFPPKERPSPQPEPPEQDEPAE